MANAALTKAGAACGAAASARAVRASTPPAAAAGRLPASALPSRVNPQKRWRSEQRGRLLEPAERLIGRDEGIARLLQSGAERENVLRFACRLRRAGRQNGAPRRRPCSTNGDSGSSARARPRRGHRFIEASARDEEDAVDHVREREVGIELQRAFQRGFSGGPVPTVKQPLEADGDMRLREHGCRAPARASRAARARGKPSCGAMYP